MGRRTSGRPPIRSSRRRTPRSRLSAEPEAERLGTVLRLAVKQKPRQEGGYGMTELERFLALWDTEAEKTSSLMRALPAEGYDFRPDAGGRSVGEMAWHLAEGDAYNSFGIESGGFYPEMKPPGIARPRTVAELAPGYERIHADAKARIQKLRPEDLERKIKYFDGNEMSVLDILWN